MGHPRPPLSGIGGAVGVLAGTHRCALMPRVASKQSANPLWFLECGLVHVSWKLNVVSLNFFCTRFVFRVWQQFLIHGHWNVRILTPPARRVALFCEHFVATTASAGCTSWMFFSNEIVLPTDLDQHAHLVRNLIAPFLFAVCNAAKNLVHPDVDLFHFSRDCSASNVVWNCCGWACDC